MNKLEPRLKLGTVVITTHAVLLLPEKEIESALFRHMYGDWGDLSSEDREQNNNAVRLDNDRIVSVYRTKKRRRFLVVTEQDHGVTTVLLPGEY